MRDFLGIFRSGAGHWLLQRITAAVMVFYCCLTLTFLLFHRALEFHDWKMHMESDAVRIFTSLFFVSMMIHAYMGVKDIVSDYIRSHTVKRVFDVLMLILIFGYLIWVLVILWGLH